MKKLKSIGFTIGVWLFVLSLALCYVGGTGIAAVRDAGEYEDAGVFSFAPYRVLPVQVKNTSAHSQDRRMNPTRTAYMVYYQATNGSGYKWQEQAATESVGAKIVAAGVEVERRVLRIPAEGSYITVEPEQTAESYTAGLRQRYARMVSLSAVYLIVYLVAWMAVLKKRHGI